MKISHEKKNNKITLNILSFLSLYFFDNQFQQAHKLNFIDIIVSFD